VGLVPLVMVVMNVIYAASAYPAGAASDLRGRQTILVGGFAALIIGDVVLATANEVWQVMAGVALWGFHMGLTQGLLATLVADTSPAKFRGTAFGMFNLVSGLVLLLASVLAGFLWDRYGAPATFLAGAVFTGVALIGLLAVGGLRSGA
jgi:MFS family permease